MSHGRYKKMKSGPIDKEKKIAVECLLQRCNLPNALMYYGYYMNYLCYAMYKYQRDPHLQISSYIVHVIAELKLFLKSRGSMPEKKPLKLPSC